MGPALVKGDPVAAAVAATEAKADGTTEIAMTTISVTLSSGRPVAVAVPLDLTVRETLDIVSFVTNGLGPELDRRRAPQGPRILVPSRPELVRA